LNTETSPAATPAPPTPPSATPFLQLDSFDSLNLSPEVLRAIKQMGYTRPTPVQSVAVPLVFAGLDLIIQSQTGTGKTAAFAVPVIDMIEAGDSPVEVLVLVPTRELALQVSEQFEQLSVFKQPFGVVAVYGGAGMDAQTKGLKKARVVVATPGRLLDHLERKHLSLKSIKYLILDEADEMLSLGFERDLDAILSHLPQSRQTLLFSATMSEEVRRFSTQCMHSPEFVTLSSDSVAARQVKHLYHMISGANRLKDLCTLIEYDDPDAAIIFCNTKGDTEMVVRHLRKHGYAAELINGDLPQAEREKALALVRQGKARFLVATDVAARGIDISELPCVINYALPEGAEAYIHRTGRTGRAGRKGVALSLMGPREIGTFYQLKSIYKVDLIERPLPTREQLLERRELALLQKTLDALSTSTASLDLPAFSRLADRLLSLPNAPDALTRLLAFFHQPPKAEAPKAEAPKAEAPKAEAPKVEAPKAEPPKAEAPKAAPEFLPVCLSLGARHLEDHEQILDVLCDLTGLMPEDFSRIAVRATQTIFDVRADYRGDAILALQGQPWRGATLEATPWRPGRDHDRGGRDRDRDRDRGRDRSRSRRAGDYPDASLP
jgi:ATP-dependent RNA helicase DeaD